VVDLWSEHCGEALGDQVAGAAAAPPFYGGGGEATALIGQRRK